MNTTQVASHDWSPVINAAIGLASVIITIVGGYLTTAVLPKLSAKYGIEINVKANEKLAAAATRFATAAFAEAAAKGVPITDPTVVSSAIKKVTEDLLQNYMGGLAEVGSNGNKADVTHFAATGVGNALAAMTGPGGVTASNLAETKT